MHNFILGLNFDELFRNETQYLFFFYFVCYWSLIEIEITALTRSRSPNVKYIEYHRALVYNFGRKSKASFGSNYHRHHNTKGSIEKVRENRQNRPIKNSNTKNL